MLFRSQIRDEVGFHDHFSALFIEKPGAFDRLSSVTWCWKHVETQPLSSTWVKVGSSEIPISRVQVSQIWLPSPALACVKFGVLARRLNAVNTFSYDPKRYTGHWPPGKIFLVSMDTTIGYCKRKTLFLFKVLHSESSSLASEVCSVCKSKPVVR